MAEYYPLLAKAVSALDIDANEARQVLYERARKALIGQLRNANPALPQAHIDGESKALDLAIARLEAEYAVKAALRGGLQAQGGAARAPAPPPPKPSAGPPLPAMTVAGMPARPNMTPATTRPPAPNLPPLPPRPASPPPRAPQAPVITPLPPALPSEPGAEPLPDNLDIPLGVAPPPPPAARNGRLDLPRPAAPVKPDLRRRNLRGLIVAAAILAVVGAVAAAALWLRQSPEDLARITHPLTPSADAAAPPAVPAQPQGKFAERIGGGGTPAAPVAATPQPGSGSPPAPAAESSVTPVKVPTTTLRPAAAQVAPVTGADAGGENGAPPNAGPSIPVAHRAAILIDAPEDPQKMKTYQGNVVWRVEQVKREGKPTATVLRAEIDIPAARTQAVLTLQKNLESTLPASHMLELRFTIAPGGDVPGIKAIRVPEMRKEETPAGEALAGAPVPVVENFFIVGLAKGDVETAHNLELLASRNWIDVPMLLSNEKVAKLTFEKGATGERALNEAMAAWKQ